VASDPVDVPMIRHWTAGFEDANPVHTDEASSEGTRFGGVVAPR
jgi:acyl dehydratase